MNQKNNHPVKLLILFLVIPIFIFRIEINAQDSKIIEGLAPYFQVKLWAGYNNYSRDTGSGAHGNSGVEYMQDLPITGSASMGLNGNINNVRGKVELGFSPENSQEQSGNPESNSVYLRHLYASYNLNPFNIIFGQTWTPYTYQSSKNVADDDGSYWDAGTYDGRQPQIKISIFKNFYLDLIKPGKENISWYSQGNIASPILIPGENFHYILPKLAAGITVPMGPVSVNLHFVYQKFTIEKGSGNSDPALSNVLTMIDGKSITGYMIPLSIKFAISNFSMNFNGYRGKNIGSMGVKSLNDVDTEIHEKTIIDDRSIGGRLDFSFDAGICTINFGFSREVSSGNSGKKEDDISRSYYANLMFYLEKNLYIAPAWWRVHSNNFAIKDKLGLKFQANF